MQLIQQMQKAYYKAVAAEFPKYVEVCFRHNKAQTTPTKAIVQWTIGDRVTVRYEDQHGRVKYKSAIYSRFSKELKMKIKTAELIDAKLCYAVCMVELPHLVWGKTIGIHEHSEQIIVPELKEPDCYSPFMSWAQGGPIIEREFIELHTYSANDDGIITWRANDYMDGPTPLIAAMRCYVASKLGDEVEVPDELI